MSIEPFEVTKSIAKECLYNDFTKENIVGTVAGALVPIAFGAAIASPVGLMLIAVGGLAGAAGEAKTKELTGKAMKGISSTIDKTPENIQKGKSFLGNLVNGVVDLFRNEEDYFNLAFEQYQNSDLDAAISYAKKALDINENYAPAYLLIGLAAEALEDIDGAINYYTQAINKDNQYTLAYFFRAQLFVSRSLAHEALQDIGLCIELDPEENSEYYLCQGKAFLMLNDYDNSLWSLTQAINVDTENLEAYLLRGSIFHDQGKYLNAIDNYNKVISLDPSFAPAYDQLGHIYLEMDEYANSTKFYSKSIDLDSTDQTIYVCRGRSYLCLDNYQKAIDDFNSALEIDKDFYNARFLRGMAYSLNEEHNLAISDFSWLIDRNLDIKKQSVYLQRGNEYVVKQQYRKAMNDYNSAINLDPNYAEAYANRGQLYKSKKDQKAAITDFTRAIRLFYQEGDLESVQLLQSEVKELKNDLHKTSWWNKKIF